MYNVVYNDLVCSFKDMKLRIIDSQDNEKEKENWHRKCEKESYKYNDLGMPFYSQCCVK